MKVFGYILLIALAFAEHSCMAMKALKVKQNAVAKSEAKVPVDNLIADLQREIDTVNNAYAAYGKAFEENASKEDPYLGTQKFLDGYYAAVNIALERMSKAVQSYSDNAKIRELQNDLYTIIVKTCLIIGLVI
jgi:hypothetical protein